MRRFKPPQVSCEDTLVNESTVHNEGATQQVRNGIIDQVVPVKKKKKRIKKKRTCYFDCLNASRISTQLDNCNFHAKL